MTAIIGLAAGCGSNSSGSATTTTPGTAESAQTRFFDDISNNDPQAYDDAKNGNESKFTYLYDAGEQICSDLSVGISAGVAASDIAKSAADAGVGLTADDVAYVELSAVHALCPSNLSKISAGG